MKILALETSTAQCSCALLIGQERFEDTRYAPRQHTELLLPMIDHLLKSHNIALKDLDAITFGQGPGSFMGLRVAASLVQGLAFGAHVPVIPLSTLGILAQTAYEQAGFEAVVALLDARMGQIYWGAYQAKKGLMQSVIADQRTAIEAVKLPAAEEWKWVGEKVESETDLILYPQAKALLTLAQAALNTGHTVPPEKAIPLYLQDQVTG
ncbi:MAG TPA: tRNA (adenosine(37)-N6)-threonylcarbamoyltransferase complex dimerization subunit type 1 TsaB [Coxiellaceae bacterium]|nr:tRNA (adenosine(37)-N6)-threonylcarbamoyltransferase complex dimerization subunit type 1 TsaB [Coxiellaceae bacterium]